ncbi:MAG TPA: T9SS type A sorting domain-containing protein [Edaphocola sp.]|nr:T9SS type A sorting domain-containing protein [Edaphocola sp.]
MLIYFGLLGANAQTVVLSSGGNASGAGGSSSYSVGQMVYNSYNGTEGSVIEGVQQPYEISTVSISKDFEGIRIFLSVYPNPTSSLLNLKIDNYPSNEISYQLTDLYGKLLVSGKTTGALTQVSMNAYAAATYFLIVQKNKVTIKTFKIVKN